MNILNSYKRTRFFLWVNITGLAIGLAASIMLILFVVNELSYDRHFANNERIIRLNTIFGLGDETYFQPINIRGAYTELPEKVSGIEAAVQILRGGAEELIHETNHFQDLKLLFADSEFFQVFQMKFIEGTPAAAFEAPNSIVITRKQANIIFETAANALNKTVSMKDLEYTVTAVVEELPVNTHFTFDVLANIKSVPILDQLGGLEFFTFYLISPNAPVQEIRNSIEKNYNAMLGIWGAQFEGRIYSSTEKLTDIYLHSKADYGLGKSNSMTFIYLLSALALFILILAITNFINLFMAQGETRMNEIGIRKANGASIKDIIRQFFTETSALVLIAFVMGFLLTILVTPYFSQLIQKDIDLIQLLNPVFILCLLGLFVITVTLSAGYPSFYLSRFSPLDILGKHLKFSKRRLTAVLVIFQAVVTIVLISSILILNKQMAYLENLPKNYNPENVLTIPLNNTLRTNYEALKQELLNTSGIQNVSGADHQIGGGSSGESFSLPESQDKQQKGLQEYRIMPGLGELMEFQLVEGEFFKEDANNADKIILNESAVKSLGLQSPVVGKHVLRFQENMEIIGVVKDFISDDPASPILPLALSNQIYSFRYLYIKLDKNINRMQANELVQTVLRKFDSEFVLNPAWSEDIYIEKFDAIKTQSKLVGIGSLLSVFIAMIGLLAIHLYTAKRRTKEIGIRRINGASPQSIFSLLSLDIIQWIVIAGIIAVPVAYYIASEWLNNYGNHTSLGWLVFILPILIQCLIAIITTSGVSINVLSQNPVKALKSE
jgi:putative ABC transport system permease protein